MKWLSDWRREAAIKRGREQAAKDIAAAQAKQAAPPPTTTPAPAAAPAAPSPAGEPSLGTGMAADAAKKLKARRKQLEEIEAAAVR